MKREIEFRAKSIDGYWVSGDLHLQCKYPHIHTAERRSVPIYPKTIGQFTGLTDRNGIAIYEGDVLNCHDGYPEPWVRVVRYSADLVEETPTPGFVLASVKGVSVIETFDEYDEFEVIGNEFDNPSLVQRPCQKKTDVAMKRTMYVIQRNDGAFYWKHQSISSFNGFDTDFSKAALYKSEKQAQNIADMPCHKGNCRVRKVTITLDEE